MRRALAILLAMTSAPGCERADRRPSDLVEIELTGVAAMPPVRITVPRFGARWSRFPALYLLQGGALRDGFMTTIIVSARDSCFSPRCEQERISEDAERRTQTCTTDRGTTVHVEHRGTPATPLCCVASWTSTGPLSEEQQPIASAVERACARIRR